jgi:hypothetical protein
LIKLINAKETVFIFNVPNNVESYSEVTCEHGEFGKDMRRIQSWSVSRFSVLYCQSSELKNTMKNLNRLAVKDNNQTQVQATTARVAS